MTLARRTLLAAPVVLPLAACVAPAQPDPAVIRETPPPWPAPRDAVSYITAAGLPHLPLDATANQRILTLAVTYAGQPVEVPAYLGIDRLRAVQAACHTHDTTGQVWLEGEGNDQVTLGQLFTCWGVRFSGQVLGDRTGTVTVTADGQPVADVTGFVLARVQKTLAVAVA